MNKTQNHRFISVVVCTHNGSTKIIDCLESLKNQTYSRSLYEVVLVNDGSTDDTQEIISKYPFTIIHKKEGGGLAAARNTGYLASKGEIVAFTDDDCIPAKNWIEKINEMFDADEIVGISGMVETYETKSLIQKYIDATRPLLPLEIELSFSKNIFFRLKLYMRRQFDLLSHSRWESSQEISAAVGANMAFRRSIIDELGGFNPKLTFGGEDEEFCYRIHKRKNSFKKVLWYFPDVLVKHKFESQIWKSVKRNYSYGRGSIRVLKENPERSLTLFPFSILFFFTAFVICTFARDFIIFLVFIPFLLYFHWLLNIPGKSLTVIIFPFIQLILESSFNLGVLVQIAFGDSKV